MSIAAHPPRLDPTLGSRLVGDRTVGSSQPLTDLLPESGSLAPAPASTPERVLARDALRLIRLARASDAGPMTWFAGDLAHEVEAIRCQLEPIRTRRALSSSYQREASNRFHGRHGDGRRAGIVRLAYTLRWLELGPDRT